jgi:hypothetical protein
VSELVEVRALGERAGSFVGGVDEAPREEWGCDDLSISGVGGVERIDVYFEAAPFVDRDHAYDSTDPVDVYRLLVPMGWLKRWARRPSSGRCAVTRR